MKRNEMGIAMDEKTCGNMNAHKITFTPNGNFE